MAVSLSRRVRVLRPRVPTAFWVAAALVIAFSLGIWVHASGLAAAFWYYHPDIIYLAKQSIWLTVISGGLAIGIAVPLGVLLSRPFMARYGESGLQILNIGQTVPTLAVLALSMSFLGIGTLPAVFALTIYTMLPIARNTYAGLKAVPAHMLEAASGMGMSATQILFRVEIPNALYVIFAGIRTALAINIGTVPLAFLIGAGTLGELIFTGIALAEPIMMLAGAIPTALLAILVDMLIATLMYIVIPKGVNPLRAKR